MTEPKLLTEAEWRDLYGDSRLTLFIETLRERGMIAEEPVDPLLVEARERVAYRDLDPEYRKEVLLGNRDSHHAVKIELAALRRGREIGLAERPTLTREMVRKAVREHIGSVGNVNIDRLHAALLECLQ